MGLSRNLRDLREIYVGAELTARPATGSQKLCLTWSDCKLHFLSIRAIINPFLRSKTIVILINFKITRNGFPAYGLLLPGKNKPIREKGEKPMNLWTRVFGGLLLIFCLLGCLQLETTVRVKPDGSGTLESMVMLNPQFSQLMQQSISNHTDKPFNLLDEERLRREAENMGPGVRFVSAERIISDNCVGYRAFYNFDNINTLTIDPNSDKSSFSGPNSEENPLKSKIKFSFTKGATSALIIHSDKPHDKRQAQKKGKTIAAKQKQKQEISEEQTEMMKNFFQGMRIALAVEIEGSVVATNATHLDGSRITLVDMDFDQLLNNPEQFQKLARTNPKNMREMEHLMRGLPGVKFEPKEMVTVKFR